MNQFKLIFYVKLLICGYIILSISNLTEGQRSTNVSSSNEICIPLTSNEINQKLSALQSVFPDQKTKLDLVIVLDRSQSIQLQLFNQSLLAVSDLFNYLVKDGRLYLHKNYARIALLSFGRTITLEFEGISDDDRTFDGCEIQSRLASLKPQTTFEDSTQISAALSKAASLFNARRNQNVKQVMWIFYDGGLDVDYEEDMSIVEGMRRAGVVIFSVAIGKPPLGWMDTVERENRVKSFAKDKDHAACIDDWVNIFRWNTPLSPKANTEKVYSEVDPLLRSQPATCGTCQGNQNRDMMCACDTVALTYGCYACSVVEGCSQNREITRPDTGLGLEWWLIVIIIVIAVIVMFSTVSMIVGLIFYRRDRKKPELPLPPRKNRRQDLHIMNNDSTYYNNQDTQRYEDVDSAGEEGNREETTQYYTNDMIEEQRQHNMDGWDTFLLEEARTNSIKHLGVFSIDRTNDSKAWTPGFKVSKSDLKSLEKLLNQDSTQKKNTIKFKSQTYSLESLSSLNIHATSSRRKGGVTQNEDMHISRVDNYLVIGVADVDQSDVCEQKVCEIRRHLENGEMNYENGQFTNDGYQVAHGDHGLYAN